MDVSKDDVNGIVEAIKRFLPDFNVTKEDLVKVEPSFVISFYHRYLNELARTCKTLFECDAEFDDILEIRPPDLEAEMFLFLQTSNILNKIGVPYFTLCDFYRPSNRTRLTIKVCLNFLLYIKENLPQAQSIIKGFNDKVMNNQLKTQKVFENKNEIEDISYKVGLYQEKLCQLEKDYGSEEKLQTTPLDTQIKLDYEVEELEKKLEEMKIHLLSQEHSNVALDAEVKELRDKVVSDNYESQKETLEQLKTKIEQDKLAILQSETACEEKCKDLECIKGYITYLQKCNISPLEYIETIDKLKQKIKEIEFIKDRNESCINEKRMLLKLINENTGKKNKDNEKQFNNLQSTLLKMNNKYNMWNKQLQVKKKLYVDLENKCVDLSKQLEDSKAECAKTEEELVFMQTEIQRLNQIMQSSQSLITTTFNDTLLKIYSE